MVISLNPVISSNTTGVIAFGKSETRTRASLNTGRDTIRLSKTSKNLHGFFPTVGHGIKRALRDVIILATVFTGSQALKSCGPDITEDIKPNGMQVYKDLPLDKTVDATFDSLGFEAGYPKTYLDERTGEYIELTKNEAKSVDGKWIGTETHSLKSGTPNGTYEVEFVKTANKMGIEKKHYDGGTLLGTTGFEMSENATRDGIKQTKDGVYNWLLHPPVNNAKERIILAEFIKNDVKTGLKSSLKILAK